MSDLTNRLDGAKAIAYERTRQVIQEGYDLDGDDRYVRNQLVDAAICYATKPEYRNNHLIDVGLDRQRLKRVPVRWPWPPEAWNPSPADRRRELVKAGALIAAEIDRLDRLDQIEPTDAQAGQ